MTTSGSRFSPRASPSAHGTLKDFLAAAEPFARLSRQANRLQHLQSLLDTALPPHLAPGTHIANLKQGKAIIHTSSGAVAVKLRQMTPRLVEVLNHQSYEVTRIEVRVQARRPPPTQARKKMTRNIGKNSKLALTSLSSGLEEGSPVRRAIEKLLANFRDN